MQVALDYFHTFQPFQTKYAGNAKMNHGSFQWKKMIVIFIISEYLK